MAYEEYFQGFQTDGAGSGPQAGGMDATPAGRQQAWARYKQSQEMNRYAMLNNPLTASLTALAGTALWGDTAAARLRSDEGRMLQSGIGRMLGNNLLGASNNPLNLMYGIQQATAGGGFRFGFKDSAYGLGERGASTVYGGGYVSDMLATRLSDGVFKHFYNAAGGQNTSRTYGMGMTDLGVMMNELQSRGAFAGMNAGKLETMSATDWQSRMDKATGAERKVLAEMQKDSNGNRVGLMFNADTERKINQFMEDSAKAVASIRNVFGGRGTRELMRQAELITGMSFSDPSGPAAVRNRLDQLSALGEARGLSTPQVFNMQKANTDAVLVGWGQDPSDPRQRGLAANLGMRITEQALGSFFPQRENVNKLREKGVYLPEPLLNEKNAQLATSLTRMSNEHPELIAAQVAMQNAAALGINDTSALQKAISAFGSANTRDEVMRASGDLHRQVRSITGKSTHEYINSLGGVDRARTLVSADPAASRQFTDALVNANNSQNFESLRSQIRSARTGDRISGMGGVDVSNDDVISAYWAMASTLSTDEVGRVAEIMSAGGSREQLMAALDSGTEERFSNFKSGDRTGFKGAIDSLYNMGRASNAAGYNVSEGYHRMIASNSFLSNEHASLGNIDKLRQDQVSKLLKNRAFGEAPAGGGGIIQNILSGVGAIGDLSDQAQLAWAKAHAAGGVQNLAFGKDGGLVIPGGAQQRTALLEALGSHAGGSAAVLKHFGVNDEDSLWSKLAGGSGTQALVDFLGSKGALWASSGAKGTPDGIVFADKTTQKSANTNVNELQAEATAAVLSGKADLSHIDEKAIKERIEKRDGLSQEERSARNIQLVKDTQASAYDLLKKVDNGDMEMTKFLSEQLQSNSTWKGSAEVEISKRRAAASSANGVWDKVRGTKEKNTEEADMMQRALDKLQKKADSEKKPYIQIELVMERGLMGKLYNMANSP